MYDGFLSSPLDQLLKDAEADRADYLDRGVVSVYLYHDTFTPKNVRDVWHNHPRTHVPERGDVLDLPTFGHMGTPGRFRVVNVVQTSDISFELLLTDVKED
jgi:hypothetical protein